MILLDTMVIVEPLRAAPHERVIAWLDSQLAETVCVASLSIAEVLRAVERLPAGRRERAREASVGKKMIELFEGRIIPFDTAAAHAYVKVIEQVRRAGFSISRHSGQLAAIATAHNFAVASGETVPFTNAGLHTTDPWQF
jgi:predicted nucleic acid-binding protein